MTTTNWASEFGGNPIFWTRWRCVAKVWWMCGQPIRTRVNFASLLEACGSLSADELNGYLKDGKAFVVLADHGTLV